jgi:ChpA-C
MHEVARRSAVFAAATGGLLLTGVGCASADSAVNAASVDPTSGVSTIGDSGLLSGNAIELPVNIPVDVCGTDVLGNSSGDTACGAAGSGWSGPLMAGTIGDGGLLSGNAVQAPVSVPVDVCGTDVLGNSSGDTACIAGSSAPGTDPAGAGWSADDPPAASSESLPIDAFAGDPVAAVTSLDPPAADPSGTLAQTGSDVALPWSTAGAATLMSGATLSAIAFKARSAAGQL